MSSFDIHIVSGYETMGRHGVVISALTNKANY